MHLEKLEISKNVSEPLSEKTARGNLMNLEKGTRTMLGSGSCDLNAASPHFLFCHTCPLQFIFCISYSVFCISYFAFSHLLRLFFCFTGFLNQRAEEEQVCSAAYIAVIAFLRVTFCRMLQCILWQEEAIAVLVQ